MPRRISRLWRVLAMVAAGVPLLQVTGCIQNSVLNSLATETLNIINRSVFDIVQVVAANVLDV